MDKDKLLEDKAKLQRMIQGAQQQANDLQVNIIRWSGALAYIEDNLKEQTEEAPK